MEQAFNCSVRPHGHFACHPSAALRCPGMLVLLLPFLMYLCFLGWLFNACG